MWQALIGPVLSIIDKVIPDPQAKAAAQLKMLELQQAGEFKQLEADMQLALGQLEVNKEEAKADPFRGGWRPFVGWVCGFGLAYQFLVRPIATGFGYPMPGLETDNLLTLLFGMLGLGAYRTKEKLMGLK